MKTRPLTRLSSFAALLSLAACNSISGVGDLDFTATACQSPAECPAPASACVIATCEDQHCGTAPAPEGTEIADQASGDCLKKVCDGAGAVTEVPDDTDAPPSTTACQSITCSAGVVSTSSAGAGTACEAGGLCDGAGHCLAASCANGTKDGTESDLDCGGSCAPCAPGKTCGDGHDCTSLVCTNGHCAPPACTDGLKNGTESDLDCGGAACPPCDTDQVCKAAADCQSGVCTGGHCAAASCGDGVKNASETDVDCGGQCPDQCDPGQGCGANQDCKSGVCAGGSCAAPSCGDGVKNGGEADIDCGGPCAKCAPGATCAADNDCASAVCDGVHCVAPACDDQVKNGSEADVDCGGACPSACADGAHCGGGKDCQSGVCDTGTSTCATPTCMDGVENASETDVDCGGPACAKCADTKACSANGDCASAHCMTGTCVGVACNDAVKNGMETDVDCGGPACARCAPGKHCGNGTDCTSLVCTPAGICAAPSCNDGVENGGEVSVDCGGPCANKCAAGSKCSVAADCQSGVCATGICQAPSCNDGVENGAEGDIDCGGSCAKKCGPGQGCQINADCAGGACNASQQCSPTCTDGVTNNGESDTDCGGAACPKCADGKHCTGAGDCLGGVCHLAACCTPEPITVTCDIPMCGMVPNNCGQLVTCTPCTIISVRTGDAADQQALSVAIQPAATPGPYVYLAGSFKGTLTWPGCPSLVNNSNYTDAFLVRLDANGTCKWAKQFASIADDVATSVAYDPYSTNVVVVGSTQGPIDFGGGVRPGFGGKDIFVAAFDSNGVHSWSKVFGSAGNDAALSAAIGPAGKIAVTGFIGGPVSFGAGNVGYSHGADVFVTLFDKGGGLIWNKSHGDPTDQVGTAVAADTMGNLYVAGTYRSPTLSFGGNNLPYVGGDDIFLVSLNGATGATQWSKGFGGAQDEIPGAIAADKLDGVVWTGGFQGTVNFGGGALQSAGSTDVFVVDYDKAGVFKWHQRAGDASAQSGAAVAVDKNGDVLLTGKLQGTMDLGGGPLTSAGSTDVFLAKLGGTSGTYAWSRRYGGTLDQVSTGIAVTSSLEMFLTGYFAGSITFNLQQQSAGSNDIFLARLTP